MFKKIIYLTFVILFCLTVSSASAQVIENFDSYTVGTNLSSQGWTMARGNAVVINGADGTKSIRNSADANYYSGTRNSLFTSPIDDSKSGQAYYSATITPKLVSGYVQYNSIGTQMANGAFGPMIGFDKHSSATSGDGKGCFCVRTSNTQNAYKSTDIAWADHTYDIRLQMEIISRYSVTGTLYYRDVTPGSGDGIWHQSSIANLNLNMLSASYLSAQRVLAIEGGLGGELDNFQMGIGSFAPVAQVIENFENYVIGAGLSSQGWTMTTGQDAVVIDGADGTLSIRNSTSYYTGTRDLLFTSPIDDSKSGQAYYSATITPRLVGGYVQYNSFATQMATGYFGPTIGFDRHSTAAVNDGKGCFYVRTSNTQTEYKSTDIAWADHTYDIRLQMEITSRYSVTGTLYYRDVTIGSGDGIWHKSSIANVNLNMVGVTYLSAQRVLVIAGGFGGELDNFQIGTGTIEDFDIYTVGTNLSLQGWTMTTGNAEVINTSNGTVAIKAANNYYYAGTRNLLFTSPIDDSKPGQAYYSATITPKVVGGYVQYNSVATQMTTGYFGPTIGFDRHSTAASGDGKGCFYVRTSNAQTEYLSTDIAWADHTYDIRLQMEITSRYSVTGTLYYRDVTIGSGDGIWHKSSIANVNLNMVGVTYLSAQRVLVIAGGFGGELDNFKIGVGKIEDFDTYTVGTGLSPQGWNMIAGDAVIVDGKDGTPSFETITQGGYLGQRTLVFTSPIDDSQAGQAYYSATITPKVVGGYVQYNSIRTQMPAGDYSPMFGMERYPGSDPYDGKGRFYLRASNGGTEYSSTDIAWADHSYDTRLQMEITSRYSVTGTLYYRDITAGLGWIQSSIVNVALAMNLNSYLSGQTVLAITGAYGGEFDNFDIGMGHISGVLVGYDPYPLNGTAGVAVDPILTWTPSCKASQVEVYFGTDSDAIAMATTGSAEYMGLYDTDDGFDVLDYDANGLVAGETYFWKLGYTDANEPAGTWTSDVWSFTVNGGIVVTDQQQAELNSSPVYTPIIHQNHGLNGAYDLFGYDPRFEPGIVTFDSNNTPYIIAGKRDTDGEILAGTVIQTLNANGRWIGLDPYQSIKDAYPDWDGVWSVWDRYIVFDNDDDAYMVVRAASRNMLLYSTDLCRTWTCHELPVSDANFMYGGRLESRRGFNEIVGPPVIVGDTGAVGGAIEIIVPTKSGGVLTMHPPVTIYNDVNAKSYLCPRNASYGNVMVTKGNLTHIFWMSGADVIGDSNVNPIYAATYDRSIPSVSGAVLVGYTKKTDGVVDEHNGPVVTMDSSGYLHVVIGAHGGRFKYAQSYYANSTVGTLAQWNAAEFGPDSHCSYTDLVCDADNTLHLAYRWAVDASTYRFQLNYMKKTAGGSWQFSGDSFVLVNPVRQYYMCWYSQTSPDRNNRLFLSYIVNANQLNRGAMTGEIAAYEAKWPKEGTLRLFRPDDVNWEDVYNTIAHDPVLLMSDDGGNNWRIAVTNDFNLNRRASNPGPSNGATGISVTADLSWTAGSGASSHNVYFGTDSTPDETEYKGNQAGTTYDLGTLTAGTTYYWRIDEVGSSGTTIGKIWSFTTLPTFVAAGTAMSGTGNITVAWPAHQTGDVALLFIESCGGQAANLGTPAGFAVVTNSPQSTGTTTNGTRITVYWCRATSSSMASPVVTDPGDHVYGRILTFRGVTANGNPWDVTAGGVKATASTTTTFGTVTTGVANELIVLAASRDNDSTSAAWSSWTNTGTPAIGLTERSDGGTTSGNGGGIGVATGIKAAAGAIGSSTATVTSSKDGHMTIALKP
ncbi:MAG: hypothetical protein A2Y13_09295 [Planctomycetes bacterium GWC2_45_44]|nr:MAG: hypothetical protein A2Y13_09295 [Planctomycetes bacterium GWC2_45_44]HBR20149.1 hypothetical protein [Phycisphaerales bacterium]